MFKNSFQGGAAFEIFSSQGSAQTLLNWKIMNKNIQKTYEKQVKGYCHTFEKLAKIHLPKQEKQSCYLIQPFLCIQCFIPFGEPITIELVISDLMNNKRRFILSSSNKEMKITALHVMLPMTIVKRGVWLNLCFDLISFVSDCFKGHAFRSLDQIVISGLGMKIRKIFLMKQQPPDTTGEFGKKIIFNEDFSNSFLETIPKNFQYPFGVEYLTQVITVPRLNLENGHIEKLPKISTASSTKKVNQALSPIKLRTTSSKSRIPQLSSRPVLPPLRTAEKDDIKEQNKEEIKELHYEKVTIPTPEQEESGIAVYQTYEQEPDILSNDDFPVHSRSSSHSQPYNSESMDQLQSEIEQFFQKQQVDIAPAAEKSSITSCSDSVNFTYAEESIVDTPPPDNFQDNSRSSTAALKNRKGSFSGFSQLSDNVEHSQPKYRSKSYSSNGIDKSRYRSVSSSLYKLPSNQSKNQESVYIKEKYMETQQDITLEISTDITNTSLEISPYIIEASPEIATATNEDAIEMKVDSSSVSQISQELQEMLNFDIRRYSKFRSKSQKLEKRVRFDERPKTAVTRDMKQPNVSEWIKEALFKNNEMDKLEEDDDKVIQELNGDKDGHVDRFESGIEHRDEADKFGDVDLEMDEKESVDGLLDNVKEESIESIDELVNSKQELDDNIDNSMNNVKQVDLDENSIDNSMNTVKQVDLDDCKDVLAKAHEILEECEKLDRPQTSIGFNQISVTRPPVTRPKTSIGTNNRYTSPLQYSVTADDLSGLNPEYFKDPSCIEICQESNAIAPSIVQQEPTVDQIDTSQVDQLKMEAVAVDSVDEDETLELVYDSETGYYYDPLTNKYYELDEE